jgi:GT2 family glycosyltransferase
MLNLAIVYPVFNGIKYTQNGLHSLFSSQNIEKQDAKVYVVIVDDGSTDGTYEWIKVNYPNVHLLKGNGSLWWSGGINLAVVYAINQLSCDYIVWWNNDIIANKNYFSNLISHLKINNINTIIGSKIYHAHLRNCIWSMGGLFDARSGKKSLIGTAQQDSQLFEQITECDWLPGMGTVTHKSVYEKIGMLDEKNFPQYHGDSDFTFRAKKNGCQIIVHPDLKIYNDTLHSGIRHNESLRRLLQSLFSIKSNYNISKDYLFYKKHSESIAAYSVLIDKYYKYIGGFFKWKIFGIFGIERSKQ